MKYLFKLILAIQILILLSAHSQNLTFQDVAAVRAETTYFSENIIRFQIIDGKLTCSKTSTTYELPKICTTIPDEKFILAHFATLYGSIACGITSSGKILCWTDRKDPIKFTPKTTFKNPTQMLFTEGYVCVLDDAGLTCWDDDRADSLVTFKEFTGVKEIMGAGWVVYALKGRDILQAFIPDKKIFLNPFEYWKFLGPLSSFKISKTESSNMDNAGYPICAIEFNRVLCARSQDGHIAMGIRTGLQKPISMIAVGPKVSCAVTSHGIKCWDSINGNALYAFDRPQLVNVSRLKIVADDTVCAEVSGNFQCWVGATDLAFQ